MPECINCDEEFKGEVIHSRLGITCPKCAEELRILDRELKAEQSVRCDSTILQPISTISQVKRLEIMNTWLRGEWPTIAALSDEAILEVYIRYQFGYEHLKHELNKRKILSFERAVTEKVKELKEKGEAKVARAIKKGEKKVLRTKGMSKEEKVRATLEHNLGKLGIKMSVADLLKEMKK